MVDWEKVFRPFLNWQTRKKIKQMETILADHSSLLDETPKSEIKPITGTFIYPLSPEYDGIHALSWTEADWITEFQRLMGLGIDTSIFHASVLEVLEGKWYIFYPMSDATSKDLQSITQRVGTPPIIESHVLSCVLNAAKKTQMKIHVGLFFPIKGWFGKSSAQLVRQIQKESIAVAKDLLRVYADNPALAGWYISPEIIYPLHGKQLNLDMNAFYKEITDILKAGAPNIPVGISPGSHLPENDSDPVIDFWLKTLTNSGVDLLYPMDAIGQLVNFSDTISKLWPYWCEIAKKTGVSLWANCECFERRSFNTPNAFESAHFNRLLWQLAACSPYVEKVVSWECMFFLNSKGAIGGAELEKDYQDYFNTE